MRFASLAIRTRARADAVGAGVLIAILVSLVAIGIGPVRSARSAAQASREAFERRVGEARDLARVVQDMTANVDRLQNELRRLDIVLKPPSMLNARLAEAAELAARHGIEVDQLTPATPEKNAKLSRIPIRMAGRGSFIECVSFLEAMHREFRDVAVRSVRLKAVPDAGGVGAELQVELAWSALPDSGA